MTQKLAIQAYIWTPNGDAVVTGTQSGAMSVVDGTLTIAAAKYNYTSATVARSLADILGVAIPSDARLLLLQVENQAARYTADGSTTPTSDVGMLVGAGGSLWYNGSLANFQIIQTAATSKLNVELYK